MRLVKIKDAKDLGVFKDVVSMQIVDGKIEAVVVKVEGKELRITKDGSYTENLKLLVQEPQEEKKMFRVVGTYMGMNTVPKEFDEEFDATQYIISMNDKLPYGEEHSLSVEPYSVFADKTEI